MKSVKVSAILAVLLLSVFLGFGIMLPTTSSAPQDQVIVFNFGANYEPPPVGHFNYFAPGNLPWVFDLVMTPLTHYFQANDTYVPGVAKNWSLSDDYMVFKLELRKGVKWHDGTELTAKDVIATWYCLYLRKDRPWKFIKNITVVDDYHLIFYMKEPNDYVPFYVLWHYILVPYKQYGQFAERVLEKIRQGYDIFTNPSEFEDIRKDLMDYRPDQLIGYGPYKVKSVTESMIILEKFKDFWNGEPPIDEIHIQRTTSGDVYWALLLDGKIDWYWGTPTPEQLEELMKRPWVGTVKIRRPLGPCLYFNKRVYPLSLKEVRQAFAYAINRTELAWVEFPIGGIPEEYIIGFSNYYLDRYINETFFEQYLKQFRYEYNPAKAEEILQSLGFKKGADGIYVTPNGTKLEFELLVDGWLKPETCEVLAAQLEKVGIKINIRTMETGAYWASDGPFYQGRYDIGVGVFASPGFSFDEYYVKYNKLYPGHGFPELQRVPWSDKPVNVTDLAWKIPLYPAKLSREEYYNIFATLAYITGDQVPVLPLFTRPVIIAFNKEKFAGWPDSEEEYAYWAGLASYAAHGLSYLFRWNMLKPIIQLEISVEPSEGGTTNPAPGTYKYTRGETVTIKATPASGYNFEKWIVDGKEAGKTPTLTITMDNSHVVKAVFAEQRPPVELYAGVVIAIIVIVVIAFYMLRRRTAS